MRNFETRHSSGRDVFKTQPAFKVEQITYPNLKEHFFMYWPDSLKIIPSENTVCIWHVKRKEGVK